MKTGIIVLTAIVLLFGCARLTSRIEITYDDFYDDQTVTMAGNILAGTSPLSVTHVELNAEEYRSRDGKILYSLIVDYSSNEWLFIRQGESLVLDVDGQRIGLKGNGSAAHRGIIYGDRVREKAWYGISYEALEMIAHAEEVRLRVIGTRHEVERYFSEQNFRNLKHFVRRYGT